MMNRKTIYIETSIVSYLTARPTNDLLVAAWQKATVDWWDTQRIRFDLYTSDPPMLRLKRLEGATPRRRSDGLRHYPICSYFQ